jgi:hypothetical protein
MELVTYLLVMQSKAYLVKVLLIVLASLCKFDAVALAAATLNSEQAQPLSDTLLKVTKKALADASVDVRIFNQPSHLW